MFRKLFGKKDEEEENRANITVSAPFNFQHVWSIGWDTYMNTFQVKNIPPEWKSLFSNSENHDGNPPPPPPPMFAKKEDIINHLLLQSKQKSNLNLSEQITETPEFGDHHLYLDLILVMFSQFDYKTLVTCSRVCKKWCLYANTENVWKWKVIEFIKINKMNYDDANEAIPSCEDIEKLQLQGEVVWKYYFFFLKQDLALYTLKKAKALCAYQAGTTDELSFNAGDILVVLKKSTGGWWEARKLNEMIKGWIPSVYVQEM